MNKSKKNHWNNYWDKGGITTFQNNFHDNYDHEILSFWQNQFSTFEPNQTIIDVGTGHGALLELLNRSCHGRQIHLKAIGIDKADISEKYISRLKHCEVHLLNKTPMESTGLENASIDHAVSQYGFEYGNMQQTINELNRILKPKATITFIIHTKDSAVISDGENSLKQIDQILNVLKIPQLMRNLLPKIEQHKKNHSMFKTLNTDRIELNSKINQLIQFANQLQNTQITNFFLENSSKSFDGSIPTLEQKLKHLESIVDEVLAHKGRMIDLISVAYNDYKLTQLEKELQRINFIDINSYQLLYKQSIPMGICITANRG